MNILIIVLVFLAIGAVAYFGFRSKKTATGKVTTVSPSPKKIDDNTTKKDVVL